MIVIFMDVGRGNPDTLAGIKGFHFQLVIRAVNNAKAWRLAGIVTDDSFKVLADEKFGSKRILLFLPLI